MPELVATLGGTEALEGARAEYDRPSSTLSMTLADGTSRAIRHGDLLSLDFRGLVVSWSPGWRDWVSASVPIVLDDDPLPVAGRDGAVPARGKSKWLIGCLAGAVLVFLVGCCLAGTALYVASEGSGSFGASPSIADGYLPVQP